MIVAPIAYKMYERKVVFTILHILHHLRNSVAVIHSEHSLSKYTIVRQLAKSNKNT